MFKAMTTTTTILLQETVMEQVEEKEEMVVAFSWRIHELSREGFVLMMSLYQ